MKADDFSKEIRNGKIPPVCLLYGDEPLLVQEAISLIRKKLSGTQEGALQEEVYHGSDADAQSIFQSVSTLSLFGKNKLVIVKGVDRMPDKEKEKFMEVLTRPLSGVTLVFTADKADMRRKFFAGLQKKYPAVRYYHPYDARAVEGWIRSYLRQRGFDLDPGAARFLCEAHGRELQIIKSELDKIILYMGGERKISLDDVTSISGQSLEFNAFELSDAVGDRDMERSLRVFSRLMEGGIPILMILGALAAKFRKLWLGKELQQKGATDAEVLKSLKITYKGDRLIRQLQKFQIEEIEAFYLQLLSIDEAVKGGIHGPERKLERLILGICRCQSGRGRELVHLLREF